MLDNRVMKQLLVVVGIFCIGVTPMRAQVVIGRGADTATAPNVTLLELKVDHTKDTAQGLIFPGVKTIQKEKMTKKGKDKENKFPEAGMVFDFDRQMLEVYAQQKKGQGSSTNTNAQTSSNGKKWNPLSFAISDESSNPELRILDTSSVKCTSCGGTSTGGFDSIELVPPRDYAFYREQSNGSSGGNNNRDTFNVFLRYGGISLRQGTDFTVVPCCAGSASTGCSTCPSSTVCTNCTNGNCCNLKVKFLTFHPEEKAELDMIAVQVYSIVKR